MTKTAFGLSAILVLTVVSWAQDSGQQTAPVASSTSPSKIQGCLTGSDGNFVLTQDNTTTAVKLVGAETQLKDNIGHEVSVTGQMINPTAGGQNQNPSAPTPDSTTPKNNSPTDNGSSTTMGTNAFQVTEVRIVSDTCNSTQ